MNLPFFVRVRRARHEQGFSLVELSIVIAIVLVLTAIAVPVFINQQKQAHITTLKADVTSSLASVSAWQRAQGTATASPTDTEFNTKMRVQSSPDNTIQLFRFNMADPQAAELCVQGRRVLDGVTYTFSASTKKGTLAEASCVASPVLPAEQVG